MSGHGNNPHSSDFDGDDAIPCSFGPGAPNGQGQFAQALFAERQEERVAFVARTIERAGITDPRVLAAMRRVPRHRFISSAVQAEAYCDYPLPIGQGQTTSQPYIVAYMVEQARIRNSDRCLEIGTGSGYQTAVLAELAAEVFSIEYFATLADRAHATLEALGYHVHQRTGDGADGWAEAAPFDAIVVSAAPEMVPTALLSQLELGGRLILPLGPQYRTQTLELWTRRNRGEGSEAFTRERLIGVQFVPFLGSPRPFG